MQRQRALRVQLPCNGFQDLQGVGIQSLAPRRHHCQPHREQLAMCRIPIDCCGRVSGNLVRFLVDRRAYGILWPVLRVTVFPEDILEAVYGLKGLKGVNRDAGKLSDKLGMLLLIFLMATALGRQVWSMALCIGSRYCSIARDADHKQQSAVPCWLGSVP